MRTGLFLLPLLLLTAAAHAIEGGSSPADSAALVDPNVPASPYAGVGSIGGGTGTLIDSTHVLTAAHVVFDAMGNPTSLSFVLNRDGNASEVVGVSAITPDPLYHGVNGNDSHDLAIVTLSHPVTDAPFYSFYTGPLNAGTTLTLVGYGQTGDGVSGYTTPDNGVTKRVGFNNADGFLQFDAQSNTATVDDFYTPGDQSYIFDFDGPTSATNEIGGTTLGNGVEANIGVGDSGGPAFVSVGGQLEIAGINNFTLTFGPDNNPDFPAGKFGSGGGGQILSAYTEPGGFLAPYAAPEPGAAAVFALGGTGILAVKRRRRRLRC